MSTAAVLFTPRPSMTSFLVHSKLTHPIISSAWHYGWRIHTESHLHTTSPLYEWPSCKKNVVCGALKIRNQTKQLRPLLLYNTGDSSLRLLQTFNEFTKTELCELQLSSKKLHIVANSYERQMLTKETTELWSYQTIEHVGAAAAPMLHVVYIISCRWFGN